MDLLENLKMSLLNFNFVRIYIIQKILVLLKKKKKKKKRKNYLKPEFSNSNFIIDNYNRLLFKKIFFLHKI